jgi:protein-S-isoprenylcysteine O-methyltransferase Ste14
VVSWSKIARRIRVPLGFVLAIAYFWLARPTILSILMGATVAIGGVVIRALASGHVTKDEQLTTSGPYAYVRNPLYFGSILIGVGFAVAARNWWIVALLAVMFVAIYLPVIRDEEKFLRAAFPEYDEYSRDVPRLIPRLVAFGKGGGRFSWDLYRKHREYNAVLGTVAMLVALAAKLWWAK